MLKKILVAYDGSPTAAKAFDFALELARAFNGAVFMLSVARPPEPATMVETTALLEAATEHFQKDFEGYRVRASSVDVSFDSAIAVGHPADQIVHYASEQQCDLIVMGHRGKSLMKSWLLGSISRRVVSYAPCSVTIVR